MIRLAKVRSRRTLLLLALQLPILLPGVTAVAQEAAPAPPKLQTPHARRVTIDDRVKVLAKNLDLNATQQASVKKILEQRQEEMLRLRTDPSIPGTSRVDRLRAIQDRTVERIRTVLNDEQKKRYDPLAVRRLQPAQGQRSVEDWLKLMSPQ